MKLEAQERNGHLYPERHLNVFVGYHGHGLDANVTRAVVSTLRWSRPELARDFVVDVAGLSAAAGTPGGYLFDLLACDYEDFHPARVKHQVVLGVSVDGTIADGLPSLDDVDRDLLLGLARARLPLPRLLEETRRALGRPELGADELAVLIHTLEELEQGSAPDGWVFSPAASTCVLIEAKLTRLLDLYQLRRYAEVYFDKHIGRDEVVLRRWSDLAAFFGKRQDDPDPVTAFLCRQLHDYLDLLGLTPFDGFRPYDFDADAAQEALPKFLGFVRTVRARAAERGLSLADPIPAATGARLPFADPGLPGELLVELRADGVRVELRLGDAPQGRFPHRAAVDAALGAARDGERNPLEGASVPAGLGARVERLTAPGPDGEAFPSLVTWQGALEPSTFGDVLAELRRQHPSASHGPDATGRFRRGLLAVGRALPKPALLEAGPRAVDAAVDAVADALRVARLLAPDPTG